MSSRECINAPGAPTPIGPYVHAVGHNGVLYCSGSLPMDPATGELDDINIATETNRALSNLEAVCIAAGTSLRNALRMAIYTTVLEQFQEINQAYAEYFVKDPPARTTIGVAALPKGARVEIDAIVAMG